MYLLAHLVLLILSKHSLHKARSYTEPVDELQALEMLMKEAEEHATEIDYLERCHRLDSAYSNRHER